MDEREKLVIEINKIMEIEPVYTDGIVYQMADWILKDRKRIVAPLVRWMDLENNTNSYQEDYKQLLKARRETLKLAGASHDRT